MEVSTFTGIAEQRSRHSSLMTRSEPRTSGGLRPWVPNGVGREHQRSKDCGVTRLEVSPQRHSRSVREEHAIEDRVGRLESTLYRMEEGIMGLTAEFETWVVVAAAQQVAVESALARFASK